jgi:hypothetical protein
MYGAEVRQIPTREINKILSTEMDVLRRSARKSRMERMKNEHIKEITGVKGKPDITDIKRRKDYNGMATSKGCHQRREYQNYGMNTTGEKEKMMSNKSLDGRSTSSHDNKKFRTRSTEKQGGMVFGFWKTATGVKKNRTRPTKKYLYLGYSSMLDT